MIPRGKPKKLETFINTFIKEHWKKMAEIPQKSDFYKKNGTVC